MSLNLESSFALLEAKQSHFWDEQGKVGENFQKIEARRIGHVAQCTYRVWRIEPQPPVKIITGATHIEGMVCWVWCTVHTTSKPENYNIHSKSPKTHGLSLVQVG